MARRLRAFLDFAALRLVVALDQLAVAKFQVASHHVEDAASNSGAGMNAAGC
jgi:hypothetical protein